MSVQQQRQPAPRPRWLVIAPQVPRPERASGDRRLLAMLELLAPHCEIAFATLSPREADAADAEDALRALGIELLGYGSWHAIRRMVAAEFETVCFEFHATATGLMHFVDALQPAARVIVDSVDLHYLRADAEARLRGEPAASTPSAAKAAELSVYRRADITLVVTDREREELRREGIRSCVVVPNIVPMLHREARERDPGLLFIGGFRHAPNSAAVQWFADAVWPRIRERVPSATWTIAGSDTPVWVHALDGRDGVRVRGFVSDTAPLLDAARVSVAPLTFGAGMKGKVSEALAAGVPVVTTSFGAQGLEAGAGTAFLLADDAEGFADAVVRLLGDDELCASLSREGQEIARRTCTRNAAAPALLALAIAPGQVSARKHSTISRLLAFISLVVRRRLRKLAGRSRPAAPSVAVS